MFVATFFLTLIITTIHSNWAYEPYYWRTINGTIPDDAVLTEDPNVFVSRVCAGGHHDRLGCFASTYNSKLVTSTGTVNNKQIFYKNHMILCTSNQELLRWEYVNINTVRGDFLKKIVSVGSSDGIDRYIGKVFHENEWKISSVKPGEGLMIWTNKDGSAVNVTDFQVLVVLEKGEPKYVQVQKIENECMICECSKKC